MKHTKGPWKIVRDEQNMIVGVEVDEGWICDTQFESIESCEANAKLIAAAPELLRALITIRREMNLDNNGAVNSLVNAAIKKATT